MRNKTIITHVDDLNGAKLGQLPRFTDGECSIGIQLRLVDEPSPVVSLYNIKSRQLCRHSKFQNIRDKRMYRGFRPPLSSPASSHILTCAT